MQGILVNLLDNSLKYTKEILQVSINLHEQNGEIFLSVKDNGPGIPKEYIDNGV